MFFKSIRWRLQVWYGLILVVVLAGFGFTAYQLQRNRLFRRIDQELQRRAGDVASTFRPPPQRPRGPGSPMPGEQLPGAPGRPDFPPPEGRPLDQPFEDGPRERPGGRPEGPPEGAPRWLGEGRLPPVLSRVFDETDTNAIYCVLWGRDGNVLRKSTNAPAEVNFPGRNLPGDPQAARMRGLFREVFHRMPLGEIVLAGRWMAPEMAELHRTTAWLSAIGAVILLLGLAGGWWSATRAIRPIKDISATATKIAVGDLSQRINIDDTDSELGRLATVLNSTFARLEGAFGEQKQFTSDAAHELRTPVSVVLTQTQAALSRERTAPEYRQTVEACQRAAQRMRRLIESLLELARLDAGQEPMKRVSFDLARTAQDCVDLIRPMAEEHQIVIHCNLSTTGCLGDPERISQVVTNLLSNAIHHNRPNGEVRVTTKAEDGSVILSVIDTGPGIAPEDLPHLFKRFYRADKARSAGGSGLGLAISKAIVEAHGGALEVASQPGEGATFSLRLPAKS
jgi:two-component system OmpR family sensor kinase